MNWSEVFLVLLACHLVGDFLVQTDWQARTKVGGLGHNSDARRALFAHLITYTLSFTPVLVWIGIELGIAKAILVGLVIFLPHLVIDDRRITFLLMQRVKRIDRPEKPEATGVAIAVDQSLHLICLTLTALMVSAL